MACTIDSFTGTVSIENLSPMPSRNEDVGSKVVGQIMDGEFAESEMTPSKIEEGLYLSSVLAAHNKDGLKGINVTHILIVSDTMSSPLYPNDFTYKTIQVSENPETDIAQHFGECINFIEHARSVGGVVFVHCDKAISRREGLKNYPKVLKFLKPLISAYNFACPFPYRNRVVNPTIVIAYLMMKHDMSLDEALSKVQTTRSIVQPNNGFTQQLLILESSLKGWKKVISRKNKKKLNAREKEKDATETTRTTRVFSKSGRYFDFAESEKIPTKIEEGLYLGSIVASLNKDGLKKLNVTHILTVRSSQTPAYPNDFTYKTIQILDTEDVNIAQYFQECYNYIEKARSTGGGVLVHCFVGMSRSASIVIAYLMKKHGESFFATLGHVKAKRPIVNPNRGFSYQLQKYEQSLIRRRGL